MIDAVPRRPKREAATAYHEAGHAVVGLWKGVPTRLLRVSIIPDPDQGTLGHVQRGLNRRVRDFELGDDGRAHRVWRASILTLTAGGQVNGGCGRRSWSCSPE